MMTLIRFIPFLALVAFLSTEVTAEVYDLYSKVKAEGAIDGFELDLTVFDNSGRTFSGEDLCSISEKNNGACTLPAISNDDGGKVNVTMTLPAPADLTTAGGGVPLTVRIALCYAPTDQMNRKWRKYEDSFKKDKSCLDKGEPFEYTPGQVTKTVTLKDTAPRAALTPNIFIRCADQGKDQYCHVVNHNLVNGKDDIAEDNEQQLFFLTDVIDSRPAELYVAVAICCVIGPVLLIGFLIYERGVLAKQA